MLKLNIRRNSGILRFLFTLIGALIATVLIAFYLIASGVQSTNIATSWIGNTFSGGAKWVQNQVIDMYVSADGTVYTNSPWDEGGREAGIYRNGDAIAKADDLHGWERFGGVAVTASQQYIYVGMSQGHVDGKGSTEYPEKGKSWNCVRRYSLSGKPAPIPGGYGWDKSMLVVSEKNEVTGLATSESELYVAIKNENKLRVYNTQTLKEIRSFSIPSPTKIAVDKQGLLWIIQKQKDGTAQISHYTKTGKLLPKTINVKSANAIAIDNQNRLLVADNGINQQILIYKTKNQPEIVSTFGVKGGIYAGKSGEVGDLKFYGITGVGVDARGNIYVNSSGFNRGENTQQVKTGTDIRKFSPNGAMQWRVVGLPFVDNADADPKFDGVHVYTMHDHYVMDYTKSAGKQWNYKGYTLNPFKYPQDIRLRVAHGSVFFRRIQGKPFIYYTDMFGGFLHAYRFNPATDGEIAIPSVMFQGTPSNENEKVKPDSWPPNQPQIGDWIWQDKNGNGAFDQGEFDASKRDYPYKGGWWVDSKGDVWKTLRIPEGIRHFPLQGIDAKGNPIYTYSSMKKIATPNPIKDIRRIEYFPDSDTMYLSGFTERFPAAYDDGAQFGSEIIRYDDWSKGNRKERWRIAVPYDTKANPEVLTASMDIAGDYVFFVTVKTAEVYVYNKMTGTFVTKFRPGPEVNSESGWIDIPYGIRAFRRASGEYLVFVEEDAKAKVIMYQLPKQIPPQKKVS